MHGYINHSHIEPLAMTLCMLSLWLLMNDPFGMNSWWCFQQQTYRFPWLWSPDALPPSQAFVESLTGFRFEWLIRWFILKEKGFWEKTACNATSNAEGEWSLTPSSHPWLALGAIWCQAAICVLVPYTHYPSIVSSFAKKNRREIVWFQMYVCCAGPIFNLNLYVPDIFCLQVENWVVVVPKGLFLFKFQLKLKET